MSRDVPNSGIYPGRFSKQNKQGLQSCRLLVQRSATDNGRSTMRRGSGKKPCVYYLWYMSDQLLRTKAIEEAMALREQRFREIGEVYEDVFASMIHPEENGVFSWPANPPRFRAIHTPGSTVIISDGLSDPFRNTARDPELVYNGFSVELFVELEGHVEFGDLISHFSLNMLGQVVQVALGHGQFSELFDQFRYLSMSLYGAQQFPEAYHGPHSTYGVLIGGPSPFVPDKVQLNIEEITLLSVRLIEADQLAAATKRDTGAEYRRGLVKSFQEAGSHSYTPLAF